MGQVTASEALATIGIVTAIFHTGLFIGMIWNKLARHTDQIKDHDERLDDHDHELRFLKGIR